jgi:hypothetical protein
MYIYRRYTYRAILEFSIRARQGTSERYSREERRQVRIVIDIRIYPSMDQPPIAGGKATVRTGNEEHRESAYSHVRVSVHTIHKRM